MQPIQMRWGISGAPEKKQFKSYQNARNKCSGIAIQKIIEEKKVQLGLLMRSRGWEGWWWWWWVEEGP